MKKSALLVALSAASLVGGVAFAQAQPQTKPYSDTTKPETTRPSMDTGSSEGYNLNQLDMNKDGAVDKQEARASASLSANFDKADINKDGKLDAAELSAAAPKTK
jgi:hypothetical protein